MTPSRIVLGVTGNIASGKSLVSTILAELGAHIIDSDLVYRELVGAGEPLLATLTARFGTGIVAPDGSLDRSKLGAIVFADHAALRDLDAITHPAVIAEVDRRVAECSSGVVVLDAVKLIESGHADTCDVVWVVDIRPDVQMTRLIERNRLTAEDAKRRINAQPPMASKLARADVVIDNSGTRSATRQQVLRAWDDLPRAARDTAERTRSHMADGKQTIDVYFDYTCPWAWGGQVWLYQVQEELGDQLDINWRFFPLEQVNARTAGFKLWELPNDGSNASLRSYQAAWAAKQQGDEAFRKFHAGLYLKRHQDGRNLGQQAVLESAATEAGLDLDKFREDITSDAVFKTVEEDFTTGKAAGVFGTPTIMYENGEGAYLKVNFRNLPKDPVTFWHEFTTIVRDRAEAIEIKRPQK